MKTVTLILATFLFVLKLFGNPGEIRGTLVDDQQEPVIYANISLHRTGDSSLVKVEVSDENGIFNFKNIEKGDYYLKASYVGYDELRVDEVIVSEGRTVALGDLVLAKKAIDLEIATVIATRSIVEVKPDRTVFNVQGTINSTGDNAIGLLRKAPGVLVDNNDNITVLSRSGVLVYIDGKRLPLSGEDLSNYLQNLPAEQIDRIDIITNPGAKYEAEGNAGIIDIRLKKDQNLGANGSISTNLTRGKYTRGNGSASGNYRNKLINIFANAGFNTGQNFNEIYFLSNQNAIQLEENFKAERDWSGYDYRVGIDLFANENHTIGAIVSGRNFTSQNMDRDRIGISKLAAPAVIDSVLIANNSLDFDRAQNTFNLNYRFEKNEQSLNVDADYGYYRNDGKRRQPNTYYDAGEENILSQRINTFDTPRDIDIYTFKLDYETKLGAGKLSLGSKLSKVATDNTFLFYDVDGANEILNNRKSNQFKYDENVYAGYINFSSSLGEKWNLSLGIRAEQTNAKGDLQAFLPELEEDPVVFDYLSWFPSGGLTYQMAPKHTFSFNYGRRINRPDYNVLNPFNFQLSELSFEKGNPFLQPEIVNNYELGYTYNFRYNFKFAYSHTIDQITRLIGPSQEDVRANFISWDNLATQDIYSLNISAPVQVTSNWNAFINFTGSYLDNQADYGGEAIVDVQAWSYNMYQQHTFDLPKGFKAEVSGWYSGPGVWGGVFRYDPSWSLNLGLQKKFFNDQLNTKLSFQDIFYESGWTGTSEFNGLFTEGYGNWDSRNVSLSLSYNFGNQKIKSRKRKTGLEEESKRVGQ